MATDCEETDRGALLEGEGIANLPITSQIPPQQTVPDVHWLVPFVSSSELRSECSILCKQPYKHILQDIPICLLRKLFDLYVV